jgi:hypothetical protein
MMQTSQKARACVGITTWRLSLPQNLADLRTQHVLKVEHKLDELEVIERRLGPPDECSQLDCGALHVNNDISTQRREFEELRLALRANSRVMIDVREPWQR